MGNFAAKFLSIIFKPEELINRNSTGTRGKGKPNAAKITIVKKVCIKALTSTKRAQSGGNVLLPSTNFCEAKSGMATKSAKNPRSYVEWPICAKQASA